MGTPGTSPASKIINGVKWVYLKRDTGRNILCREPEYELYQKLAIHAKVNFHSLYLHKQMTGLSADTGTINNLFSRFSALKRKLQLPGGALHYEMRGGEVLLTQLEIDWDYHKHNTGMGLFTVRENQQSQTWDAKPTIRITTPHAAVNGTVTDIKEAAKLMPAFIKHGYPQAPLGDEYALFHNPYNGPAQADWNCIQDSTGLRGGSQAARQLAAAIELAASKDQVVNWTVHERGCAIWKQALRLVNTGHDYSNQTVFYANPVVNMELMDQQRKRLNMKLASTGSLTNEFSLHQNLIAGNWVSEPVIMWQNNNKGGAVAKVASQVAKIGGMGTALAIPGLVGAAAWAIGLAAMLGPNLFSHYSNQGVIKNQGDALNHYIFKRKK